MMKRQNVIGVGAALMLLAGTNLVAAQQTTGTREMSLSDQQRQTIWRTLSNARDDRMPPNFEAQRGATLPSPLRPRPLPRALTDQVPAVRGYGYVKTPDRVMIVNRQNGTIVERIWQYR
jgi:hypothetical protein